jgi:hypothetical protein
MAHGRVGIAQNPGDGIMSRMVGDIEAQMFVEENHSPVRSLVKDGAWQVPAAERPKDWEKMGLREFPGAAE